MEAHHKPPDYQNRKVENFTLPLPGIFTVPLTGLKVARQEVVFE
jgi:hypothetical protein